MSQAKTKHNSWSRVSRGAISAIPIGGSAIHLLQIHLPQLIWPPLGGIEVYAAGLAVVVIAVFGKLPSLFKIENHVKKWMGIGILAAVVSLSTYVFLLSRYVKGVETPDNGIQYRTIGSQRSAEAEQKFAQLSDQEIMQIAGLTDGDIERMWTPSSVANVKFELFFSYVFALGSINFVLGALALESAKSKS
jgi:hypothetical protein